MGKTKSLPKFPKSPKDILDFREAQYDKQKGFAGKFPKHGFARMTEHQATDPRRTP